MDNSRLSIKSGLRLSDLRLVHRIDDCLLGGKLLLGLSDSRLIQLLDQAVLALERPIGGLNVSREQDVGGNLTGVGSDSSDLLLHPLELGQIGVRQGKEFATNRRSTIQTSGNDLPNHLGWERSIPQTRQNVTERSDLLQIPLGRE